MKKLNQDVLYNTMKKSKRIKIKKTKLKRKCINHLYDVAGVCVDCGHKSFYSGLIFGN